MCGQLKSLCIVEYGNLIDHKDSEVDNWYIKAEDMVFKIDYNGFNKYIKNALQEVACIKHEYTWGLGS